MCQTPAAPLGYSPVLVSLNGIDYTEFPAEDTVAGVYGIHYYVPPRLSAVEPPGGPVAGGTLVALVGAGLSDFGMDPYCTRRFLPCIVTPTSLQAFSMGAANGGGYVIDKRTRAELNLTRGVRYRIEIVGLDNPLALTLSSVGGPLAAALLVTTGVNINPLEYGEMLFTPDASLPDSFYYQSTRYMWTTTDRSVQRINLFDPVGPSTLRFGEAAHHPLAALKARNGSMIQAIAPAQPPGTATLGVVFSPNAAEEDYVGPLPYAYHDEVRLDAVVPSGSPIFGGTNVTLVGSGFAQARDVLTDARVRCLFDARGSREVLPVPTPVSFRNDTHLVCETPPSRQGRPPYLTRRAARAGQSDGRPARRAQRPHPVARVARRDVLPVPQRDRAPPGVGPGSRRHPRRALRARPRRLRLADAARALPLWRRPHVAADRRQRHDRHVRRAGGDGRRRHRPRRRRRRPRPRRPQRRRLRRRRLADGAVWYYPPPVLESVWPLGGVAAGGTTVSGRHLARRHTTLAHAAYDAPDAPKCLFHASMGDVGWVASNASLGTTVPPPEASNATRWTYVEAWSAEEVVCRSPNLYGGSPGAPTVQGVALALNGQQFEGPPRADGPNFTVYDEPLLRALTPSSGPAIGGALVRLHGHALDSLFIPGVSLCRFGALAVPIDDTRGGSLSCTSPPTGVGAFEVTFTLNGQDEHGQAGAARLCVVRIRGSSRRCPTARPSRAAPRSPSAATA